MIKFQNNQKSIRKMVAVKVGPKKLLNDKSNDSIINND